MAKMHNRMWFTYNENYRELKFWSQYSTYVENLFATSSVAVDDFMVGKVIVFEMSLYEVIEFTRRRIPVGSTRDTKFTAAEQYYCYRLTGTIESSQAKYDPLGEKIYF
jgi:hypothetical protein